MITQSLRRFAIEEWRGLPAEDRPERMVPMRDAIERTIAKLGLGEQIFEGEIVAAWREIVGDFLAAHSKPARLSGGILHVVVLQPTIRYDLDRTWKPQVVRKLQERFGARVIRDVQFRT